MEGSDLVCKGWPAPGLTAGLNDLIENWGNSPVPVNWEFDGDEDLTTYPGYFAVAAPATGSFAVFAPIESFLPYPRTVTNPYPLIFKSQVRLVSTIGGTNLSMFILDFATDAIFSGDYLEMICSYQVGEPNYRIECNGGPLTFEVFDTGIPVTNDVTFEVVVTISDNTIQIFINGVLKLYSFLFNFPQVGYLALTPQRHGASDQGVFGRTEIYTQAP